LQTAVFNQKDKQSLFILIAFYFIKNHHFEWHWAFFCFKCWVVYYGS